MRGGGGAGTHAKGGRGVEVRARALTTLPPRASPRQRKQRFSKCARYRASGRVGRDLGGHPAKNLAGSVRVVRCGISFGRVGKTRPSVTRLRVEPSAPCVRFAGNLCRFEASRERGDSRARAATTPLHATRVRTPRRFSERGRRSLARGMRVASGARPAPRADARGLPRGASDRRPQPPSAARRSRTRVAPLGGRARRDDARREHSPARHSAVAVASRRVRGDRARAEADTTPIGSPRETCRSPLVPDAGIRFLSTVDRPRTDDVSTTSRRRNEDVFETSSSSSVRSDTTPSKDKDPLANETRCLEASDEGTVLGAVALITGSTVGAGALALPATVSPAGIGPSSAVLLGCWGLLVCEALLLAEVNVALMRERDGYRLEHGRGHSPVVVSLSEMAGRTLGAEGAAVVGAAYSSRPPRCSPRTSPSRARSSPASSRARTGSGSTSTRARATPAPRRRAPRRQRRRRARRQDEPGPHRDAALFVRC